MKLCVEFGQVVSKQHIEKKDSYIFNGKEMPARDERFVISTISGSDCDNINGYESLTLVNHTVDKEFYDKIKFGDSVKVKYNYNGDDKPKSSQGITLVENKK